MIRRAALTAALTTTFAIAAVAPALAAPGNGAGQATFPMRCGGRVVTLTIANGTWSAAYVRETGQRFIPKATYLSIVHASTGEILVQQNDVKPGAAKQSNVVCVDAAPDDGVIVTFAVHGRLI